MTYRDLAESEYMEQLGLQGVHYTTIHKAIKRLPETFPEEAMRIIGGDDLG
ncbi:MAG: hypothetical protein N2V72_02585 [Methanophagales archaeon]|nr:hypothetical protein [Methanophagales archaeon]